VRRLAGVGAGAGPDAAPEGVVRVVLRSGAGRLGDAIGARLVGVARGAGRGDLLGAVAVGVVSVRKERRARGRCSSGLASSAISSVRSRQTARTRSQAYSIG
jgi:hypothetical protein